MAITQNTATKKPMSIAIQSNVAKKLRITITPSYSQLMVMYLTTGLALVTYSRNLASSVNVFSN